MVSSFRRIWWRRVNLKFMAHFHWTLLLSGVRFYNLANGRSKISILSWALQRLLRFIMTKQLRKRLYGPHLWIADNTVPSFLFLYRLKVYRLSLNGEYIRGWVTSGSGGITYLRKRYSQYYNESYGIIRTIDVNFSRIRIPWGVWKITYLIAGNLRVILSYSITMKYA